MTIATVREDGYPVNYVNDGLTIDFATAEDTQKVRNIARNNKVSVTINGDYGEWDEIEGLSMAAMAKSVSDPEVIQNVGGLLFKKFPQIAQYYQPVPKALRFSVWNQKQFQFLTTLENLATPSWWNCWMRKRVSP